SQQTHRGRSSGHAVRHRSLRASQAAAVSAERDATSKRRLHVGTALQRLALLVLIVLVWWVASLSAPVYILPTPARVLQRIIDLSRSGDLPYNLLTTLARVLVGFAFAVVIGVPA